MLSNKQIILDMNEQYILNMEAYFNDVKIPISKIIYIKYCLIHGFYFYTINHEVVVHIKKLTYYISIFINEITSRLPGKL